MKTVISLAAATIVAGTTTALGHYGMIIPSDPMLSQEEGRSISMEVSFSHPFELRGMELVTPVSFNVTHDDEEKAVELGAVIWVHFEDWTTE